MIRDLIGVGFGPANIALAVAFQEDPLWSRKDVLFLEARPDAAWQPNMLTAGSDIQNNPLRDLVTPRNPTSKFSFISFLHDRGRFLHYLNLGVHFPLRKEFAAYVAWVAERLEPPVHYDTRATQIELTDDRETYKVVCADGSIHLARVVVLAPGRTPLIPPVFESLLGDRVFHLNDYMFRTRETLRQKPDATVCVVGSSQSAVEIVLDLHRNFPQARIFNIMRSFGYQLKDTSPFSGEVYFPEFVDYFHRSTHESREALTQELRRTNYSAADQDVIEQLYMLLYEQKLDGVEPISLLKHRAVTNAQFSAGGVELTLSERHHGGTDRLHADLVILATGFRNFGGGVADERWPPILKKLVPYLAVNEMEYLEVKRDYSLAAAGDRGPIPPLYVNGLCETSHGFGDAGSFSLLAIRAGDILRSLKSREKPFGQKNPIHTVRTAAE